MSLIRKYKSKKYQKIMSTGKYPSVNIFYSILFVVLFPVLLLTLLFRKCL